MAVSNHPKQADLTWPKKKKSQGLSLRFLVVIRHNHPKRAAFWESKTLANYVAKVGGYTYRYYVLSLFSLSWIMRLQHGGCNFPG